MQDRLVEAAGPYAMGERRVLHFGTTLRLLSKAVSRGGGTCGRRFLGLGERISGLPFSQATLTGRGCRDQSRAKLCELRGGLAGRERKCAVRGVPVPSAQQMHGFDQVEVAEVESGGRAMEVQRVCTGFAGGRGAGREGTGR